MSLIVTHLDWIWTFPGQNGGSQYLYVMKEYSIYSLGILNQYTFSMEFGINVKGNCPVIIGQRNTTERIGLAFLQAFNRSLVGKNDADITYGYVCYISRIYMEETLFYFSKYIITPMQMIGYRCCNNTFDIKMRKDNISCHSTTIMIDKGLWWNFQYVMGWLIFIVLSISLMNALSNVQSSYSQNILIKQEKSRPAVKVLRCRLLSTIPIDIGFTCSQSFACCCSVL
jgi:hypothetical protein